MTSRDKLMCAANHCLVEWRVCLKCQLVGDSSFDSGTGAMGDAVVDSMSDFDGRALGYCKRVIRVAHP